MVPVSGWPGGQAGFVPGYSGGPATELHRVPFRRTERFAHYPVITRAASRQTQKGVRQALPFAFRSGQAKTQQTVRVETAHKNGVAGKMIAQFGETIRTNRAEQRRAANLAERHEQASQSLRGRGQPFPCATLPVGVEQRLPGDGTRGMREWPGADHFADRLTLFRRTEEETDTGTGQPKEFAERAKDDQIGRRFAPGQIDNIVFRFGIAESLIDDQPATSPPELCGSIQQSIARS